MVAYITIFENFKLLRQDLSKHLEMTPRMRKYYNQWIKTPTLFGSRDIDKFYQFAKACIRYGRKRRSGSWLRIFLEEDIQGRFSDDHAQDLISKAVSIFDHIVDYENVEFPDHLVEMKNPDSVSFAMESYIGPDGKRFFTDKEIEEFINRHF